MESTDWVARWQAGKIGFHEGRPNTFLEKHAEHLAGCRRVLVPLCGKAEDLAYLTTRGHEVIGVELVEDAVKAFFEEHSVIPKVTRREALVQYATASITVYAGDVFAVTGDLLGPGAIDAIYDRAALVALPPEIRRRYVAHLRGLAPTGARVLLVSLEYPQDQMAGPPFAVLEAEVRELYAGARIEVLDEAPDSRLREGWPPMTERCYLITL